MVFCRFRFLAAVFPLIWLMAPAGAVAGPDRPNVLLIVAESQGHGEAGFRGNVRIDTPHLDRLAASGIKLDQFHVCPDRATSLASLLTGRYHYRTGVSSDSPGEGVMHGHEITLGEVFRHAGYATGFFGPWQNGDNWPQNAPGQGFERSAGDPLAWLAGQAAAERPFFCLLMVGIDQAPPALVEKYRGRDGIDARTAAEYARIEAADTEAGRAIEWLDSRRLRERTVVWYLAARGTSARKDDPRPRFNAHWRGVFQMAVGVIALRLIILSFELAGDLLMNGLGLIFAGMMILGVAWGAVRVSKRFAPRGEEGEA